MAYGIQGLQAAPSLKESLREVGSRGGGGGGGPLKA